MSLALQEDSLIIDGTLCYFQPGLTDMFIKECTDRGLKYDYHYKNGSRSVQLEKTMILTMKYANSSSFLDSIIKDYSLSFVSEDYTLEHEGIRIVKLALTKDSVFNVEEICLFVQHRTGIMSAVADFKVLS